MPFNVIDILLGLLVVLSLLNGWRRGFILGVLDLVGWALVLLGGLRFYQPVAEWLGAHFDLWSEIWDRPIAFVLVAIAVGIAVHLVGYACSDGYQRRFMSVQQIRRLASSPGWLTA